MSIVKIARRVVLAALVVVALAAVSIVLFADKVILTLKGSNLGALQKLLDAKAPDEAATAREEAGGKRVEIDRLIVRNGRIAVSGPLMQGRTFSVPLPTIELKDIGKGSEKTTVADVTHRVLSAVVTSAGSVVAASGQLGEQALEALAGAGGAAAEAAKAALAKGTAAATGAISAGADAIGGAVSGAGAAGGAVGDAASGAAAAGAAAVGKAGAKVSGALGGLFKKNDAQEEKEQK